MSWIDSVIKQQLVSAAEDIIVLFKSKRCSASQEDQGKDGGLSVLRVLVTDRLLDAVTHIFITLEATTTGKVHYIKIIHVHVHTAPLRINPHVAHQ